MRKQSTDPDSSVRNVVPDRFRIILDGKRHDLLDDVIHVAIKHARERPSSLPRLHKDLSLKRLVFSVYQMGQSYAILMMGQS